MNAPDSTSSPASPLNCSARRLPVITGAGISADSGLPTYRGIGGLYNDRTTEDQFDRNRPVRGNAGR